MYEKYKYLRDIYNQSYIVINQRDINAQNSQFRSNSSISNFSKNKIQKFWRRRHKFRDIITYQILQQFQSDFYYIPHKFQTLITWACTPDARSISYKETENWKMFELRVRRDYGSRGKDRNFMFVSRNGAVGCEDDKPEIAWFELWRGKM